MLKRLVYFGYYLKELDIEKFCKFVSWVKQTKKIAVFNLYLDIIKSSFKYNISILEYFYFRFFNLSSQERKKYAGTGYMYEYQLIMNPKKARTCLDNKIKFMNRFSDFIKRNSVDLKTLKSNKEKALKILSNNSGKIVLKRYKGKCGRNIEICNCKDYNYKILVQKMKNDKFDLVEECVVQHSDMMSLSPSGVNTIRIITQLVKDKVIILAARLRISVNSYVDNLAAGNTAAYINLENGVVEGRAVYSDITKGDLERHPVTKTKINGFKIPFWSQIINLARQAALTTPENRSVGWDIAVTEDGPELIEGNHDWCKLLWQLPVKKGLKEELEKYL